MTDTTRNRSAILARFLRGAVSDLLHAERRGDAGARTEHDNALQVIVAVADELELHADLQAERAPDPAESRDVLRGPRFTL